jgi:hypothetical protein
LSDLKSKPFDLQLFRPVETVTRQDKDDERTASTASEKLTIAIQFSFV